MSALRQGSWPLHGAGDGAGRALGVSAPGAPDSSRAAGGRAAGGSCARGSEQPWRQSHRRQETAATVGGEEEAAGKSELRGERGRGELVRLQASRSVAGGEVRSNGEGDQSLLDRSSLQYGSSGPLGCGRPLEMFMR